MKLLYSWMENTVIQHAFLKFDQSQTNHRFSIKTPEPQMKHENPRSSEKSPAVTTLIVTVCATKKCVSVTLRFCSLANMRCAGVDWPVHTILGNNSTVWCRIFRVIKVLMRKPKKYFNANQRHFLRNQLHQSLVEPDQNTMFYQLPWLIKRCVHEGRKMLSRAGNSSFFKWSEGFF